MCLYLASCLFTFTLIGHLAHSTKQTDFHTSGTWGLWSSAGCSKPHKLETKVIISAIYAEIVFLSYQQSMSNVKKNNHPFSDNHYLQSKSSLLRSHSLDPFPMVSDDATCLTCYYMLAELTQLDSQSTMKFKLVTSKSVL